MVKKWIAGLLCLILTAGLAVYGVAEQTADPTESAGAQAADTETAQIDVYVTFDAMREFTVAVGGTHVNVTTIIPTGTEPHDFEPKAQDLVGLAAAQVFVYNGLGMESWVKEAVSAVGNENLVVVEASLGADAIVNTDPGEVEEHGQYDPHIWLSLKGAELEAKNIRDGLILADPANQADYEQNYSAFAAQLEALLTQYSQAFADTEKKTIVTGHAAFAYLCRDLGLVQNSVEDTFAEGEPTAMQLTELIDFCKTNGVTTIFAEEMASPEVSQTLADEVGAKVETIYTIESAEDGMTYLERMESNLAKIEDSLKP
jgi:zinc transport system substrate-binding protein